MGWDMWLFDLGPGLSVIAFGMRSSAELSESSQLTAESLELSEPFAS